MNDTFLTLYNEFLTYADKNDEQGARTFLTDNFQQFPEEVQKKLIFILFEEALMDTTKGMKHAMSPIDKARKHLEEHLSNRRP